MAHSLLVNQDGQHLFRNRDRRLQFLHRVERELDIDRDNDVNVHRPDDVDRQVADKPAINQQAIVELHRCQDARDRHAGTYCKCQIAPTHHVRVAGFKIRCDGAKWDRQLIEVLYVGHGQCQLAQYQVELLALNDAERQLECAALQSDIEIDRELLLVLLTPEAKIATFGFVGQAIDPVRGSEHLLQFSRTHARGIEATNDRTHARAGNGVDGDTQSLEFSQDANMRRTSGASAAEHQPYAWPLDCRSIRVRPRFGRS